MAQLRLTHYTKTWCQGGEMLYILDQRLHAQSVQADKSKKGSSDLLG